MINGYQIFIHIGVLHLIISKATSCSLKEINTYSVKNTLWTIQLKHIQTPCGKVNCSSMTKIKIDQQESQQELHKAFLILSVKRKKYGMHSYHNIILRATNNVVKIFYKRNQQVSFIIILHSTQ